MTAYVEARAVTHIRAVVTHASSDIEQLSDERLETSALQLAAAHLSRALGQPVQPSAVRVGHICPATGAEQAAEVERRIDGWGRAFAHLPWQGQLIVAGWMFPELRKGFTAALQARGVMVGAGDEVWRSAALQAMAQKP